VITESLQPVFGEFSIGVVERDLLEGENGVRSDGFVRDPAEIQCDPSQLNIFPQVAVCRTSS
jgi:hypothetical protein